VIDFRKEFVVKPGAKIKLSKIDPAYKGKHVDEKEAQADLEKYRAKLTEQQNLLYSERSIPCCMARWIASVLRPKQNCHSNYSMGGSNALCIPKK
jgi:hypothetical protein